MPQKEMVYNAPVTQSCGEASIKVELQKESEFEDSQSNAKMDVCALTLAYLAQDSNLPPSKLPFAWKLFEMLEAVHKNGVDTDAVSWVDDGKAFKVHNLEKFVEKVIPPYFKQTKYKSFQRQLYIYGFTRVPASAKRQTAGSYYHPKFFRGDKLMCLSMQPKRTKRRNRSGKTLDDSGATTLSQRNQKMESNNHNAGSKKSSGDSVPIPIAPSSASVRVPYENQRNDPTFLRQQNNLLKLQRQQFYSMIVPSQSPTDKEQTNPVERTKQQQRRSIEVEERCRVFGGKIFHTVTKKGYFEYSRKSTLRKQIHAGDR